jgi:hypothetical protein
MRKTKTSYTGHDGKWPRYRRVVSLKIEVGITSQINKWANTDPRKYRRWDQMPRRSKHPLPTPYQTSKSVVKINVSQFDKQNNPLYGSVCMEAYDGRNWLKLQKWNYPIWNKVKLWGFRQHLQYVKLIRYQFWCTRCAFRLFKSLQWYSGRKSWKSERKQCENCTRAEKNNNPNTVPWSWAKSVEG